MAKRLRRLFTRITESIALVIAGLVVLVVVLLVAMRPGNDMPPEVLELTLGAVSTQSNRTIPTLAAEMTRTPAVLALTGAAPTLAPSGRLEVRQWAATAQATSERDAVAGGAVQAAGPPNTSDCGDAETAWATQFPNSSASLTLLFPELVTPTGLYVHQTFNPGFITLITLTDIYGEEHIVYQAVPQAIGQCPLVLYVPIDDADYQSNRVTITVDQSTSAGGWNQIDAVQMIGISY